MPRVLAVLPIAFLGLFFLYPLLTLFRISFAPTGGLDLSPFRELLIDPYYRRVLWFSSWQAALSTLLTLLLGLPMALLFARYRFAGQTLWRALASLPFVLPVIVVATAFSALLGPRGLINTTAIAWFDLAAAPIDVQNTLGLMMFAHVFYNLSLVLRIVGGFWANLDEHLAQAAQMLGASRVRAWREVTLPLLLPALGSAALLIFIFCFGAFGTVLILAGPRYATLETEIYTQATSFLNLPMAGALSVLQMAVTLLLSAVYARLTRRNSVALELKAARAQTRPVAGRARWLQLGVLAGLLLLIGLPLLALLLRSLGSAEGLRGYAALWDAGRSSAFTVAPIVSVRNSLLVAAATVLFSLLVGVPAAYGIVSAPRGPWRRLLEALFLLPLGTSAVALGFGYIVAFGTAPVNWRASPWLLPAAHTLVAVPFVVRALLPTLRAIQPRLREAAAVLGAAPATVWREVDLPILLRGVLAAATLAFTSSIGEFGASLLITRPDFPTMPVVIYHFLGQPGAANYNAALAMSCLVLLVAGLGFVLIERVRLDGAEF